MAEVNVDMLVEMALADQNKVSTTVKAITLKLKVVQFLSTNPAKGTTLNVTDTYPAGKAHSQIISAFKKVIIANGLSKLVWVLALSDNGKENVSLIAMTEPEPQVEDDDNDNEVGVEVSK
jgi:hypothetical protein